MDILLNRNTLEQVSRTLKKPPHGLLILGPKGVGKGELAAQMSANLLKTDKDRLNIHPYLKLVRPSKKSISIDLMREIKTFAKLKTPGNGAIRRIVIIEDAQFMTTEAQNSLLKLLEEPPKDTVLILTSVGAKGLLPTIVSRVQKISVQDVSQKDAIEYFEKQNFSKRAIEKAYLISEGQMGLMTALLTDDKDHPLIMAIDDAKRILSSSPYERLLEVNDLVKNKDSLDSLLAGLQKVCHSALRQSIKAGRQNDAKRLEKVLKNIMDSEIALARNAQHKLLLTDLMLNI